MDSECKKLLLKIVVVCSKSIMMLTITTLTGITIGFLPHMITSKKFALSVLHWKFLPVFPLMVLAFYTISYPTFVILKSCIKHRGK